MNVPLFLEKISEKGKTKSKVAEIMEIDRATFYRKLQRGGDFTVKEAQKFAKKLDLTQEEMSDIFLI